jgi:hypothetical protein
MDLSFEMGGDSKQAALAQVLYMLVVIQAVA